MRGWIVNPVLGKEFRSRMRTWKSPLVISIYLGIMALISLGYYWTQQNALMYRGFGPEVGPQIYVTLAIFQLLLVSFVTPAFTAGIISGERERQTFDLLICTRLSATSIVLNKLLASISYIILLIVASLPVFAVVYFFGGVLLTEIAQVFVVYVMTALTFGAIGVFCSTIFKRTQVSVVVTYIVVFFFLVGTVAIAGFMASVKPMAFGQQPWVAYLNPLVALTSTFPGQFTEGIPFMFNTGARAYGMAMPGGTSLAAEALMPWQYNFIGDAIIIAILLAAAIILVKPVGRWGWFQRLAKRKTTPVKPVAAAAEES